MNDDFELTRFSAGAKGAKKRARTTNGRTQRAEGWSAGKRRECRPQQQATNGSLEKAGGTTREKTAPSPPNAGALRPARRKAPFASAVKTSPAQRAGHRSAPKGAGRRKSGDGGPRPPEPSGDGGPREWRPSSAMRPQGAEQGSARSNKKARGSGKRQPPHPQPPAGSAERAGEDGGLLLDYFMEGERRAHGEYLFER